MKSLKEHTTNTIHQLTTIKGDPKVVSNRNSAFDLLVYNYAQIQVSTNSILSILRVKDITHIKANSNYSSIYFNGTSILTSRTLKYWESQIDSSFFMRVHNSFLVNKFHVSSLDLSNSTLLTSSGIELPISRSNKSQILSLF